MFVFSYILLLSYVIAGLSHAYFFDECSSSYNSTVNTLNGFVNGTCYIVPVTYSKNQHISYEVMTWLSIPYAEPPIEQNRFLKPFPVKSWTNVLETKNWPSVCPQQDKTNTSLQSEDCLYLNIFIRRDSFNNKESDLRPVLIYIHGGGFIEGSSRTDLWEPSTLVASQDIIVVTFNYRVNTLFIIL